MILHFCSALPLRIPEQFCRLHVLYQFLKHWAQTRAGCAPHAEQSCLPLRGNQGTHRGTS